MARTIGLFRPFPAALRPLRVSPPAHGVRQMKFFSVIAQRELRNTPDQVAGVKINPDRLWDTLHETCEWGRGERWGPGNKDVGMSRLALSDADKQARDWFVKTTKALGCEVTVDEMGNIFAVRPGRRPGPPTYAGSHLDTQPAGGRYDGILGVHAGIEALKTMNDYKIETEFSTGVINWTNEEGSRFPTMTVSSGVWAGLIPLTKAHALAEVGGGIATQKSELERIGYLGPVAASHESNPIGAHFELHIEQGRILERSNRKIGIVEGVQAYRWFTLTVRGKDTHTGTTDFTDRSDAMLTAAKLILHSHNKATELGCLASTGILTIKPGSTNTVPGEVKFTLDMRAREDHVLRSLEEALRNDFDRIAAGEDVGGVNARGTKGRGCSVRWVMDADSAAVKFDEDCIGCVEESAKTLLGASSEGQMMKMTSGAGHDSVNTSFRAPTSMIFVPCKDGLSHNPAEYCSPEDCANGAQVLLGALLNYDQLRASREK